MWLRAGLQILVVNTIDCCKTGSSGNLVQMNSGCHDDDLFLAVIDRGACACTCAHVRAGVGLLTARWSPVCPVPGLA